jgi:hypothetical protein
MERFIIVRAFFSSSERLTPMSHPKFMRATLFATAILVPLVAGLSPVLAESREPEPSELRPLLGPRQLRGTGTATVAT